MNFIRLFLFLSLFSVECLIFSMNNSKKSIKKQIKNSATLSFSNIIIPKDTSVLAMEKLPKELQIKVIEELCREKIKEFNKNNELLQALKNFAYRATIMNLSKSVHEEIQAIENYKVYKIGNEMFLIQSTDTQERFKRFMNINNTIKKGCDYPGISEFLIEHQQNIKDVAKAIKEHKTFTHLKNILDQYSNSSVASNDPLFQKALIAVREIEKIHNDTTLSIEDFLIQLNKNYMSIDDCSIEFQESLLN